MKNHKTQTGRRTDGGTDTGTYRQNETGRHEDGERGRKTSGRTERNTDREVNR